MLWSDSYMRVGIKNVKFPLLWHARVRCGVLLRVAWTAGLERTQTAKAPLTADLQSGEWMMKMTLCGEATTSLLYNPPPYPHLPIPPFWCPLCLITQKLILLTQLDLSNLSLSPPEPPDCRLWFDHCHCRAGHVTAPHTVTELRRENVFLLSLLITISIYQSLHSGLSVWAEYPNWLLIVLWTIS